MPDSWKSHFTTKSFISIHFYFIDSDNMLHMFPESLRFMCKSVLVLGIDCTQHNCNLIRNPVNGDKC